MHVEPIEIEEEREVEFGKRKIVVGAILFLAVGMVFGGLIGFYAFENEPEFTNPGFTKNNSGICI